MGNATESGGTVEAKSGVDGTMSIRVDDADRAQRDNKKEAERGVPDAGGWVTREL